MEAEVMELCLENGKAVVKGVLRDANIGIDNGKIVKLGRGKIFADEVIDCRGKVILPGCIDAHVHFRVPGGEHKEDWKTGSRAAAAGGITTVLDMPNTNPGTTTQKLLDEKREVAEKDSVVNFGFQFGAANDNENELENAEGCNVFKVFMGSSTGSLLVTDEEKLRKIFSIAKQRGFIVAVHAEDEDVIKANMERFGNENSALVHSKIRSSIAEAKAIEKALSLQKEIGNKLHICHVSGADGIELIAEAKRKGKDITCEATPHHLFLDESACEDLGNFAKMNPSLKGREDVEALWKAIGKGVVDIVATDHAPHTREEKEKEYRYAPSGVPGVETMLPLLLNAVNEGKIELKRVVELCSENPAGIFGFKKKGRIEKGYDADLAVVDLGKEWIVKGSELKTKCRWSPFEGMKLKGFVERTFVGGRLIYDAEMEKVVG